MTVSMWSGLLVFTLSCLLTGRASSNEVKLSELLKELQREPESYRYGSEAETDYGEDYEDEVNPAEVIMTRVRKGPGNCYARGKCVYYSKRLKTEFCGNCGRRAGCFPGDSTVLKESGDVIPMAELRVDDRVLAASRTGQLTFSPVVGWLDKRSNESGQYLQLTTDTGHRITLSSKHVMLVKKQDSLVSRFAGSVEAGDLVKVADSLDSDRWSPIVSIQPTIATGAYVPLTAEGTIVVDGVLASCYASFDHDWAHVFTTPLRWLPGLFEQRQCRDDDGPRPVVEALKSFGRWLFPQSDSGHRAAEDPSVIKLPLLAAPAPAHTASP